MNHKMMLKISHSDRCRNQEKGGDPRANYQKKGKIQFQTAQVLMVPRQR